MVPSSIFMGSDTVILMAYRPWLWASEDDVDDGPAAVPPSTPSGPALPVLFAPDELARRASPPSPVEPCEMPPDGPAAAASASPE